MKKALFVFGPLSSLVLFTSPLVAQASGRAAAKPLFLNFLARPKYLTMLVLGLVAFALLVTKKMSVRVKVQLLLLSTFLYGIAANLPVEFFSGFAMHPSPVCAATKSLLYGFRMPMIVTLAVIVFLTMIGPRLFCGWVCPVGAVQELIAMLADKLRIRRRKWDFRATQAVRVAIFLAFIFLSWTAVIHVTDANGTTALSLYDYINAFHGFEINFQPGLLANLTHFLPFLLTLGLAFVAYRPFCYLVCPIGLLANLLEQAALFRIVVRRDKCTGCGSCYGSTPCPAVPELLKGSVLKPDCFACAACVNRCPTGAFKVGIRTTKESGK